MEDVGIFYGHLVYFTDILVYLTDMWHILCLFGIFYGNLELFPPRFGMLYQEKSGTPGGNHFHRCKSCRLAATQKIASRFFCSFFGTMFVWFKSEMPKDKKSNLNMADFKI
jgi:hypothetical protein